MRIRTYWGGGYILDVLEVAFLLLLWDCWGDYYFFGVVSMQIPLRLYLSSGLLKLRIQGWLYFCWSWENEKAKVKMRKFGYIHTAIVRMRRLFRRLHSCWKCWCGYIQVGVANAVHVKLLLVRISSLKQINVVSIFPGLLNNWTLPSEVAWWYKT